MTEKEKAQVWEEIKQGAFDIMDSWVEIVTKQPEQKEETWPIIVGDGLT